WLHIKPDVVDLETKYVIEGGAGHADSITVAYDDRWQLLTDGGSASEENRADDVRRHQLVRFSVPPGEADRQDLLLRWRLRNSTTLGNLRLPPIELMSSPATKRWLAISTDPSLECE